MKKKSILFRMWPLMMAVAFVCLCMPRGRAEASPYQVVEKDTDSIPVNLVLHLNNGTLQTYGFDDVPKVSFCNDTLKVETNVMTAYYNSRDINYYSIGKEDLANVFELGFENPPFVVMDNSIVFSCEKEMQIQVYSVDGRMMFNRKVSATSFTLPIGDYMDGVYLVRINNVTFKIVKL